jgi:hypothetical protein
MSKPTHTPGPWRVGAYGTTVMTGRPNSQANDTICSLYMPIHSGVGELLLPQDARAEQVEANARLIAAAPDLLEVAKDFQRELSLCMAITGNMAEKVARLEAKVNAAIAKAEGTS